MYQRGCKLQQEIYLADAVDLARFLLGKHIVHILEDGKVLAAEITETEAFGGAKDPASHSFGRRVTPGTQSLYKEGGTTYFCRFYGNLCMNVVCGPARDPAYVLLRRAEPVQGFDIMSRLRFGRPYGQLSLRYKRDLMAGPGKLCAALALDMSFHDTSLQEDTLFLAMPDKVPAFAIRADKRVNLRKSAGIAADYPYRYMLIREE